MNNKCRWCNAVLETSNGITDYKLVLQAERMTNVSPLSIDILMLPPIEGKEEFCSMKCLFDWAFSKIKFPDQDRKEGMDDLVRLSKEIGLYE